MSGAKYPVSGVGFMSRVWLMGQEREELQTWLVPPSGYCPIFDVEPALRASVGDRAGRMKGLGKGRWTDFEGGGRNKKNFASETTKCMKTLGEQTKCHDKKAKLRRKCG